MQELVALGGDAFPLAHQVLEILGDGLLGSAFGRGSDDHAHILRRDLRHDVLQAGALTLAQLAAHAGHAAGRHQHEETAGQGDLRGKPCALVADRILGYLHQHRIARLERQFDTTRLAFQTCGIPVHLAGVQHAVAGLSDVHERGLHARQHVLHAAKIDVADGGHFLDVGHVMLDEHIVFDHGDLGVALTFAHHHQTLDVFATGQEVLLHELVLTAAFTTVVAAALLLGFQTGGSFDVGDLVDVLLLAGATGHRLVRFLGLRPSTAAATATGHRALFLIVILMTATGFAFGGLLLVGFLMVAASATAATSTRRLLVIIIVSIAGLVIDRRIRDAIEDQVLLDLLHFGSGTTFLRVQTTGTTGTTGIAMIIVFGVVVAVIAIITAATVIRSVRAVRVGRVVAATAATTSRTVLVAVITAVTGIVRTSAARIVSIVIVGRSAARGGGRQNRLLEQQRRHRTRIMTRLMAFRQRADGVERTVFG